MKRFVQTRDSELIPEQFVWVTFPQPHYKCMCSSVDRATSSTVLADEG